MLKILIISALTQDFVERGLCQTGCGWLCVTIENIHAERHPEAFTRCSGLVLKIQDVNVLVWGLIPGIARQNVDTLLS